MTRNTWLGSYSETLQKELQCAVRIQAIQNNGKEVFIK
jgi:hypothetical protein